MKETTRISSISPYGLISDRTNQWTGGGKLPLLRRKRKRTLPPLFRPFILQIILDTRWLEETRKSKLKTNLARAIYISINSSSSVKGLGSFQARSCLISTLKSSSFHFNEVSIKSFYRNFIEIKKKSTKKSKSLKIAVLNSWKRKEDIPRAS